jgi:ATP phosphoribosyltransferase regulatory subunit
LPPDTAALLEALPLLTGGPEVLAAARKFNLAQQADASLRELELLHTLLTEAGVSGVLIDLGEVRRADYYSGFMFKVYQRDVGEALGGGGRYDRLFDRFDMHVPAVGFGFNLARLAEATAENGYANGAPARVADTSGAAGLKRVLEIRGSGGAVSLGGA